ncbi:hypothetical protein ISM_07620 [Roseovarius nubinhibens ISM]|uniref:Uncharacterized protein n=2 Tax=Roseovarius nubinhibens TaxID=314263 RepID=A3SLB6_ROSNI|nr:hypothetical protein ISM_07620 [Roseovarius nubinhibens ISM]
MLPARLVARCPSAQLIGVATTHEFDLEFSKLSKDGSGKATLVPGNDFATPGALFEIKKSELNALDRAEGAGSGYDRMENLSVQLSQGSEQVTATTYIASLTNMQLKPFDWYLALVIAGAQHHTLGEDHLRKLRLHQHVVDDDHTRKSRQDALKALSLHEHRDHNALLIKQE